LVTFAAALVKQELRGWESGPKDIKRRLLASADLDPKLTVEVHHGRSLNLVKALSLFESVVEDDTGHLFFGAEGYFVRDAAGEYHEVKSIESSCGNDGPKFLERALLYKISTALHPAGSGQAWVYYRNAKDDVNFMREVVCEIPERIYIKVGVDRYIRLRDVVDYVPKVYPSEPF
jgi:hypothetical protein